MCLTPSYVWIDRGPNAEKLPRPCGKCWQCKKQKVDDYTGRCLAELAYSAQMTSITLTYRPRYDGLEKNIEPLHFQNFVRALRKKDHKIRYIAVGEYGKKDGRAHFHALLFHGTAKPLLNEQEPPAPVRKDERDWIPEWPHGHVWVDSRVGESAVRYVTKYVLKEDVDYWLTMSKKPPLGDAFFRAKAKHLAELGALPASFLYMPPGGKEGREYMMSGATLRNFMSYVKAEWEARHGPLPRGSLSEWVQAGLDKAERWQHLKAFGSLSNCYRAMIYLHDTEQAKRKRKADHKERETEWQAKSDADRRDAAEANKSALLLDQWARGKRLYELNPEMLAWFERDNQPLAETNSKWLLLKESLRPLGWEFAKDRFRRL